MRCLFLEYLDGIDRDDAVASGYQMLDSLSESEIIAVSNSAV